MSFAGAFSLLSSLPPLLLFPGHGATTLWHLFDFPLQEWPLAICLSDVVFAEQMEKCSLDHPVRFAPPNLVRFQENSFSCWRRLDLRNSFDLKAYTLYGSEY
jgi:hypothetical protein